MLNQLTLGIDPGYDRCGWAVVEKQAAQPFVKAYGCIQTQPAQTIWQRYAQLQVEMRQILQAHRPQFLAIEELFFAKNTTTAIKVAQARGIVIAAALETNCQIFEYNPGTIKLAVTGHGKATKPAMTKMIKLQLGISTDKRLLDDTIDALGVALTHVVSHRALA